MVEEPVLVLEALALEVVDLQEQAEGAVDELRDPFHLRGEERQQEQLLRVSPPASLPLCIPMAMGCQRWLLPSGLRAGATGMEGSKPADVGRLALHQ